MKIRPCWPLRALPRPCPRPAGLRLAGRRRRLGADHAGPEEALIAAVVREIQKDDVLPQKTPAIVAAIRASDRAGAYALPDSNALAARVTEDLRKASGDGHLYVRWDPKQYAGLGSGESDRRAQNTGARWRTACTTASRSCACSRATSAT